MNSSPSHSPHAHPVNVRVPLRHGEIVLMVDVAFSRVHEFEHLISRRHPEAGVAGVGWALGDLGV